MLSPKTVRANFDPLKISYRNQNGGILFANNVTSAKLLFFIEKSVNCTLCATLATFFVCLQRFNVQSPIHRSRKKAWQTSMPIEHFWCFSNVLLVLRMSWHTSLKVHSRTLFLCVRCVCLAKPLTYRDDCSCRSMWLICALAEKTGKQRYVVDCLCSMHPFAVVFDCEQSRWTKSLAHRMLYAEMGVVKDLVDRVSSIVDVWQHIIFFKCGIRGRCSLARNLSVWLKEHSQQLSLATCEPRPRMFLFGVWQGLTTVREFFWERGGLKSPILKKYFPACIQSSFCVNPSVTTWYLAGGRFKTIAFNFNRIHLTQWMSGALENCWQLKGWCWIAPHPHSQLVDVYKKNQEGDDDAVTFTAHMVRVSVVQRAGMVIAKRVSVRWNFTPNGPFGQSLPPSRHWLLLGRLELSVFVCVASPSAACNPVVHNPTIRS